MQLAHKRYPISVQMYHIMADEGAFTTEDRVELIDGEIVEMSPIGTLHARCVNFLANMLNRLYSTDLIISVQNPIIATDFSEPQPDISVLRYREDFYKNEHPTGKDVLLVIEVADTSVEFDRVKKIPKYATAGIPETWLIDLEAGRVEVYTQPKETTYGLARIYQRGEEVVSETMKGLTVSVDKIIG
jgi:Uma2 family endonuclease